MHIQVPLINAASSADPPDELCWAWLSLAMSKGSRPGACSAQRVLQALPWADLATSLPGHLACLVLLDVARGLGVVGDAAVHGFVDWCWGFLSSSIGRLLMAVDAEDEGDVLEAMLALCVSQVRPPGGSLGGSHFVCACICIHAWIVCLVNVSRLHASVISSTPANTASD